MAEFGWGNPTVHSDSTRVSNPSTSTLIAELDSTQLGTKDLRDGQALHVRVLWTVGADTNATWKLESALSTGLGSTATVDVLFVKTPTGQSAAYPSRHTLYKDYRLRARVASSFTAEAIATIEAETLI